MGGQKSNLDFARNKSRKGDWSGGCIQSLDHMLNSKESEYWLGLDQIMTKKMGI